MDEDKYLVECNKPQTEKPLKLQHPTNMNKFWQWMEEKGYCLEINVKDRIWISSTDYEEIEFTEQMLIGYMIEYLTKEQKRYVLKTNVSINENYLRLESKIENMA